LARAFNFAFDRNGSGVVQFLQPFEDLWEIDLTFADSHFPAEVFRVRGEQAVFCVHAADVGADDIQRVDRIALAVEDEIRGIEVDADVAGTNVLNEAEQGDGALLAGFAVQPEAGLPRVFGDFADGGDGLGIERVAREFGDETDVSLKRGDTRVGSNVEGEFERVDAGAAGAGRDKADGGWAFGEVPHHRAGAEFHDGRGFHPVTSEGGFQGSGVVTGKAGNANLAGGKAELFDAGDGDIGALALPDVRDDTEAHRRESGAEDSRRKDCCEGGCKEESAV
jgi:hypothetical protein